MRYSKIETAEDIEMAEHLIRSFFHEVAGGEPGPMEFCVESFRNRSIKAWGAWHGDMLIGVLGYIPNAPVAIVQFFWIYPEYRNGIVGGLLYRNAVRSLPSWIKKINIFVSPSREALYNKIGFQKIWSIMSMEVRNAKKPQPCN